MEFQEGESGKRRRGEISGVKIERDVDTRVGDGKSGKSVVQGRREGEGKFEWNLRVRGERGGKGKLDREIDNEREEERAGTQGEKDIEKVRDTG